MKLKSKYILFLVILHLVCLVMSYFIFEHNKLLFMLVEVVIIISVLISLNLYKQLIAPLTYLTQGIAAIKDKDFNVKFLATGKKEVDELIDVYNKMIDELRTERTRQQEQHFFLEKLIQTSPTGIIVLDYDKQIKQINPKAREILQAIPGLLDNHVYEMKTGSAKMLRANGLQTFKIQKSKFIDTGFERIFIMIEEVTAEIFEAEKNVYSKVIRMMAHEVNNTVGPVNSIINSALSHQSLWINEADAMLKNAMLVAVDRNQNLNVFMRNFADLVKLPQANLKKIDLTTLLKSVAELMYFPANEKNINFELDLPISFIIAADVEQMEQALINIVKNAIESIDSKGVIKINLDPIKRNLTIADNGKGISEENTEQLFSPFFSTKKDGQGIGLTLVREILLNHGFDFSLKTIAVNDTRFTIEMGM
ncbi:sensor histidine kinase [Pedobacter frigiditerrae]|uniref:sensor histidine kinase n=1 Tax=Pedobacter frigiditerrae TaxID=2530452 RepID=UPI00292DD8EF|nr:ATP-binding protein [Pedobacter frigiditerrae]